MIHSVCKFKVATRDWPYVVEFGQFNDKTQQSELLTYRTHNRPRPVLISPPCRRTGPGFSWDQLRPQGRWVWSGVGGLGRW